MTHIKLNSDLPGISGLLEDKPATAKPLRELAQTLLRNNSTLSVYERELIATYVSHRNQCNFCMNSHGAVVNRLAGEDGHFENIFKDIHNSKISPKLKSLLLIADKVRENGRSVRQKEIEDAKMLDATDDEIHDTVLIAAAFCMYNRYVDGLSTKQPADKEDYRVIGERLVECGYV